MSDETIVGRVFPVQGNVGHPRLTKEVELKTLVTKLAVEVDRSSIEEATASVQSLADAAKAAREALDVLFSHPLLIHSVQITGGADIEEAIDSINRSTRPVGAKFKL